MRNRFTLLSVMIAALALGGCLSSGSTDEPDPGNPGGGGGGGGSNAAPTISGNPPSQVQVDEQYSFTPNASDPDGDNLTFSITNLPSWASFNPGTGTISGTPSAGNVGTYSGIRITVSDGQMSASTSAFSVQVTQMSLGSATLSWTPPTQNTDGSALTNLSSYKIYYGTSAGNYPNEIEIDNPGLTTYVVDNLTPNTYYFVATAINASGEESGFSNVATKVVN